MPPGPVFVDHRGRRPRLVRWAGRVVGVGAVVYLSVLGASLVGASWVPHLALPVVPVRTPATRLTLPPGAAVGPTLVTPPTAKAPIAATKPTTTAPPATKAPTATTKPPIPKTTAAPTTTTTAHGHPTASSTTVPPGRSGTSPGHTRH